jgi:hypothetical protein
MIAGSHLRRLSGGVNTFSVYRTPKIFMLSLMRSSASAWLQSFRLYAFPMMAY